MRDSEIALDLLQRITAPDRRERERAADEVTDVVRSLSEHAAAAIAGALVVARSSESDGRCQEAQLHALAELSDWHPLSWQLLGGVLKLDRASLTGSQVEYFEVLIEDADRDWDEDSDLWEHQGHPLLVQDLRRALRQAPRELPVSVEVYDGAADRRSLTPVEIGFSGTGVRPASVVITVTSLTP